MTPGAQMWGALEKAFRLHVDMSKQYLIKQAKIKLKIILQTFFKCDLS